MNFLQSITSVEFRETWEQWVEMTYEEEQVNQILASVNWNEWLYEAGNAPQWDDYLNFTTTEQEEAQNLAIAYVALNGTGSPDNMDVYYNYTSNEKVIFHTQLNVTEGMNSAIMTQIDADYNCTNDKDPEVRQRWYPMGIYLEY